MNLTQLANNLGVNRTTLYRRMKSAGIALDDYRQPGSDELTPEGVSAIANLFDGMDITGREDTEAAVLAVQLEAARREAELLREQLADTRRAVEKADAATDAARADAAAWRASFDAVQQRLLAAGNPPAPANGSDADTVSDAAPANVHGWRMRLAAWLTRKANNANK